MGKISAPTLFKAFYKIPSKSFDYCCVCLRTSSERRLVKPRVFIKFIEAFYLECDFNECHQVCYMCERQASSAYKFYKAAMFATSIQCLLKDYLDKRKPGNTEMNEQRRFQQLYLKRRNLHSFNATLKDKDGGGTIDEWECQLQRIRGRSELLQTEVLVIDSEGTHGPCPGNSNWVPEGLSEVYIVPDKPADLIAQLTNQQSVTDTVILSDEEDENQPAPKQTIPNPNPMPILGPNLMPLQRLVDQPRIYATEYIFEDDQTDPTIEAPSIGRQPATLPGQLELAPLTTSSVVLAPTGGIAPSSGGFSNTGRIVPSSGGFSNTGGIGPPGGVFSTAGGIAPSSEVFSQTSGVMPSGGVFITTGSIAAPSVTSDKFILHPVILDGDGKLTAPSLTFNLVNGVIQNQFGTKMLMINGNNDLFPISQGNNNSSVVNSADSIRYQLQKPNHNFSIQLPQQNVINNISNTIQLQMPKNTASNELISSAEIKKQINEDHLKQINDLANEIISEVEQYDIKNNTNSSADDNKMIANSNINSFGIKRSSDCNMQDVGNYIDKKMKIECEKEPTKRTDRIDWEDKIPMDVISFVDAVDPNADTMLNSTSQPCEISHVGSLNTPTTYKPAKKSTNIIDLC